MQRIKPVRAEVQLAYPCPCCKNLYWFSRTESMVEGFKFVCCDKAHTIEHVKTVKVTPVFHTNSTGELPKSVALELTEKLEKLGYDFNTAESAVMKVIARADKSLTRKQLIRAAIAEIQ